jgi:adenylylsulfate kinase
MIEKDNNIHPTFDRILKREDKEKILNQRSTVIWITGLSGSGKTTIAQGLEIELHKRGYLTKLLDGDNVRSGINNNLKFTEADRKENIRRIAEVSKLFMMGGVILINCFISPTKEIRDQAKEIVGEDDFFEIYVNTPLEVCEERDIKGLYAKARAGLIKNFTGIDSPYEEPENPSIEIKTEGCNVTDAVQMILDKLLLRIEYKND